MSLSYYTTVNNIAFNTQYYSRQYMNNKTLIPFLVALLYLGNSNLLAFVDKKLIFGTIQFPTSIMRAPSMRIYFEGRKLSGEIEGSRLIYSLGLDTYQTYLYLLVTEVIEPQKEGNTIQYLKVPARAPYKLYALELNKEKTDDNLSDQNKQPTQAHEATWNIRQVSLPRTGRVPDQAIIMLYRPDFIHTVQGGDAISLPTVMIASDVIQKAGSAQNLQDISNNLLLSCMGNLDLIHDSMHHIIKQEAKSIIALVQ